MEKGLVCGSRQWEILVLVARLGPITLVELAEAAGVARTSMQQQVGRLVSEGWLGRSRRKGELGRPADMFELSDAGRRLFAGQASGLAGDLVSELMEREGKAGVKSLLRSIGRRMVGRLRPLVGDGTLKERAERLVAAMNEEGTVCDVRGSGKKVTLTVHTCPYHGVCSERGVFCDMDKQVIGRVLGAKVGECRLMSEGCDRCEFDVVGGEAGSK